MSDLTKYNAESVDAAIRSADRASGVKTTARERKMIHALLRGRAPKEDGKKE